MTDPKLRLRALIGEIDIRSEREEALTLLDQLKETEPAPSWKAGDVVKEWDGADGERMRACYSESGFLKTEVFNQPHWFTRTICDIGHLADLLGVPESVPKPEHPDLASLKDSIGYLTPGNAAYRLIQAEIARLEGGAS